MDEVLKKANNRLVFKLAALALASSLLGIALIPFYNWICEVTGFNGKTGGAIEIAETPAQADMSRWVTVEFIGNVMPGLNVEFTPKQNKIKVRPGEVVTVGYTVKNSTMAVLSGQAVPSATPGLAAKHFKKIDCFCFKKQEFLAGESRDMPVTFFVSPKLSQDIRTITLSYAFYPSVEGSEGFRADKVLESDI